MSRAAFEFEGFRLNAQQRTLQRAPHGTAVELQPRVFDALLHFVERPGELLGKRELMEALWPRVIVEENSLNQVISQLRKALGEKPSEHRYIVTAPGRGYRFVAAVRVLDGDVPAPPQPQLPPEVSLKAAPEAFFGYLKAMSLSQQPSPESAPAAIELLRRAVEQSPEFSRAHAMLAIQYTTGVMFGFENPAAVQLARQEVAAALALDDCDGASWCAAAAIDCLDGNWTRAEERFRTGQALSTDPVVSGLRCAYLTLSVGQLQRAMQQAEYTLQLAPIHPLGVQMMATLHLSLGHDEAALGYARLSLELGQSPRVAPLADLLAVLAVRAGHREELERILGPPTDPPMRKRLMLWHALRSDLDAAYALGFDALDLYARDGITGGAWGVLWLPEMQAFRDDPRFQLFARRLRLFEYWSEYGPPDGYSLTGEHLVRAR
jgi:DNA-binding winged helix-turn-helix (wHTH) protein